jgi:GH24 family phage-related lysozyme (muramidase)
MIAGFEGLRLEAYPDPGTGGDPWTVGYGHTGPEVVPGYRVTEAQAKALLRADAGKAYDHVVGVTGAPLTQREADALASFVYNVGGGAYDGSTLLRRLNAGEDPARVIREELPRWVKGGDGRPMLGLVRRRAQEVAYATAKEEAPIPPAPRPKQGPAQSPPFTLKRAAQFSEGRPWQDAAWDALQAQLVPAQLATFRDAFRAGPAAPASAQGVPNPLPAPYLFQLDSKTREGGRMCFSSSCAMAARYLRPTCLPGAGQADDLYLALLETLGGDSTDAAAQVRTLAHLGIRAEFRQDGTPEALRSQLAAGLPCPVGWLHHGSVSAPSGGGHWSLVVGTYPDGFILHDPYGEADLVGGGYASNAPTAGRFVRYSYRNWVPRWVAGSAGWWLRIMPER